MTLSPALSAALAAARPTLNARVAAARKAQPGFDVAALGQAVRDQLDPIVAAVAAIAPERTGAVALAGFDMIVTLVGQRLIGPATRNPHVNRLWTEIAPGYAAPIAAAPAATLGRLTNAAVRLAGTPGARIGEWLALMAALGPLADHETLPAIGQIVAWRAGMAHYREGALRAGDGLPEPVALAAIGGDGEIGGGGAWPEARAAFAANRWWSPLGTPAPIAFGGFAGFDGPFAEPPTVVATDAGFLVRSGERHGLLVADAYGATLHPAAPGEHAAAVELATRGPRISGATVAAGDRTIAVDLPAEGLAAAADGHTVAITSPYSHFIALHPWRLP